MNDIKGFCSKKVRTVKCSLHTSKFISMGLNLNTTQELDDSYYCQVLLAMVLNSINGFNYESMGVRSLQLFFHKLQLTSFA